jgi:UDP-2-acetamido-2,6-beta-L-arabino-hexul-4-ose reductase
MNWKNDERGGLLEVFKLPNDGQVFAVSMHKGSIRGNHYHTRKIETFVCIYGECLIDISDREHTWTMTHKLNSMSPTEIMIPINCVHRIRCNEEDGAIVLVHSNEVFNSEDPDTYPEEVYLWN